MFDTDWLALRESFDAAARSAALAQALVDLLPQRPHLLDLGAGTGSLFRWLAPRIGRAQVWLCADADPGALEACYAETAGWAQAQGWAVSFPQRAMLVHAPGGAWRIEALRLDLTDPDVLPLERADAVLCSALLDLVSEPWLRALAERLEVPFLACLGVDGRETWAPAHPADRALRVAFRRDQARNKGFGPALGPRAPAALLRAFQAAGFRIRSAPADWRIPRGALPMLREMIEERAAIAPAFPPAARAAATWRAARLRQAAAGRLAIRIGHRDILAVPGEELV